MNLNMSACPCIKPPRPCLLRPGKPLRAAILICSFWAVRAPSSTAATRSLSDHPPFSDFYLTT